MKWAYLCTYFSRKVQAIQDYGMGYCSPSECSGEASIFQHLGILLVWLQVSCDDGDKNLELGLVKKKMAAPTLRRHEGPA